MVTVLAAGPKDGVIVCAGKTRRLTAQHPTTSPYICTPASARATLAAVIPLFNGD